MDFKDIKKIVELIKTNELSEFEIEDGDFRLLAKRGAPQGPVIVQQAAPAGIPAAAAPFAAPVAPAGEAAAPAGPPAESIDSPMVGTFYRSASPESDSFVAVGQTVEADTVVCIIEAMKVMNEIKAERGGIIKKILVDNATPVEFGQPLFEIDPA